MPRICYLDTETCGLVGPIVLIQTMWDDGTPQLHHVWHEPVGKTLTLIERICDSNVIAFNLSFDWFHINKLYNILHGISNREQPPSLEEFIGLHSMHSSQYCLKPKGALCLLLHARKGPFQSLMDRRPIRIKRVPIRLAEVLAEELRRSIGFDDIYFHKKAAGYNWDVVQCEDDLLFADVILRFGASSGLKPLISHIFNTPVIDYPIDKSLYPEEDSFNPYDTRWSAVISAHIHYWKENKRAQEYASNDVVYLERLYHHWAQPAFNDVDSELAICVGCCRWRGYSLDHDKLARRYVKKLDEAELAPIAPNEVRLYLHGVMTPLQKIALPDTKAETLESISEWENDAGTRAKAVLKARSAEKEVDILYKLRQAGRFCPDFRVIGTKSGRMSGGGDVGRVGGSINPQGIQHSPDFRAIFTLAEAPDTLSGGDFESFETVIADAVYNDANLRSDLRSGKRVQAILGSLLYDESYDTILNDKADRYDPSKRAWYGYLYGAQSHKLSQVTGVDEEKVRTAIDALIKRYPRVGVCRKIVMDAFCSMSQPGGIGSEVIWRDPAEYVKSIFGNRRYYTLENKVTKAIFELAQCPPESLKLIGKCIRKQHRGEQTWQGAMRSALFATAFQIQASNMRSAANHVIQSSGAEVTKQLQRSIWGLQPVGVHAWVVQPMNIHDEVMCPTKVPLRSTVMECLSTFTKDIPLLSIDWKDEMKDWSEK